jgi:hypothetical protein
MAPNVTGREAFAAALAADHSLPGGWLTRAA